MYEIYCKLRDSKGYKDSDVARATGITKSTFTDWKNGRSAPKQDKLQKIAEYFNVSVDYLLYGFNKTELASFINITKHIRSIKEFSKDTGIDEFYLTRLCSGVEYNQPSIDTMVKIACNNDNDWIVDTESLFKAAGYDLEEISGNLLENIPLELLHHYQEQNMTEAEIVVAYTKFRQAESQDAMSDSNNLQPDNEIQTLAAHHDGEEFTEEELEDIENFKKYVLSKRKNKE